MDKNRLKTSFFLLKRKIENKRASYKLYLKKEAPISVTQLNKRPLISVIGDVDKIYQSYDNFQQVQTLDKAEGEYVAFINKDIVLDKNTFYCMVKELEQADYDLIYSDQDMLVKGKRIKPFFKPDWSPHTLRSFNYIGFCLIKKSIIPHFDNYYDLLFKLSYKNLKVCHIPKVLVHYKKQIMEEGNQLLSNNNELVSIIIPSKDNYSVLEKCINSIREKTLYTNYEIIVVDNGSCQQIKSKVNALADKYIYNKMEFNFSKMCNLGAKNASGDFYLFLNDDTQVVSPNWLDEMVNYARQQQTGAVGCKLLYPHNDLIQHIGVINIKNGPVHAFIGKRAEGLYFGRDKYVYNYSCVTGACLMVDKTKFFGFDEELRVAYNDVDLCLKLIEKGYYNVCIPYICLYHYESVSRGDDRKNNLKLKRLFAERQLLYTKHKEFAFNDKFYNKNLNGYKSDFSLENPKYINKTPLCKPVDHAMRYLNPKALGKVEFISYGSVITVGGYGYINNMDAKIDLLLFKNNENVFRTKALKQIRPDFDNKICGFLANISVDDVKKGDYEIGILLKTGVKKYLILSDEMLNIK